MLHEDVPVSEYTTLNDVAGEFVPAVDEPAQEKDQIFDNPVLDLATRLPKTYPIVPQ